MPKPTGVQLVLTMHRRGMLADREAADRIVDLAAESDTAELVAQLPSDLLVWVRRVVAEAPTTDEDWGRMMRFSAGTFTSDYDPEAERARWKAAYRAGVVALRDYFESS